MKEANIEGFLAAECRKRRWVCAKVNPSWWSGAPDRVVYSPGGRTTFVETKAPNGWLRPNQKRRHEKLRELGFVVYVPKTRGEVRAIIEEIERQ